MRRCSTCTPQFIAVSAFVALVIFACTGSNESANGAHDAGHPNTGGALSGGTGGYGAFGAVGGSGNVWNGGADAGPWDSGLSCKVGGEACTLDTECCSARCSAGACSATACQPGDAPVELTAFPALALGRMLTDEGSVYWSSSSGAVYRLSKFGGNPEKIIDGNVFDFTIDDASVYWADGSTELSIKSVAKSGGNPTVLYASTVAFGGFAAYGGYLYMAKNATVQNGPKPSDPPVIVPDGGVYRMPVTGGQPEPLKLGPFDPHDLIAGSGGVFWISSGFNCYQSIWSTPLAPGDSAELACLPGTDGYRLAINSTDVFAYVDSSNSLVKVPQAGGTLTEAWTDTTMLGGPLGFAVDDASAYLARGSTVIKLTLSDGSAKLFATDTYDTRQVALDADCVYLATHDGTDANFNATRIVKLPK